MWKRVWFAWNELVIEKHFHINDFARRRFLKKRQEVTRKWPITQRCCSEMNIIFKYDGPANNCKLVFIFGRLSYNWPGRAQNNSRSTDNVWPKWLFVRNKISVWRSFWPVTYAAFRLLTRKRYYLLYFWKMWVVKPQNFSGACSHKIGEYR